MAILESLSQLIFNVYEAFTVALYVREKGDLKCLSSVSFAGSFDRGRSIPVEGTLPGWVIKHSEPLVIPNFDRDEGALGYYGATEHIKSFMGYPMGDEGVLVIDSKKKYQFTDKEKKIFGTFVSLMHRQIQKENQFQEMEERLDELASERRIIGLFGGLNAARVPVEEIFREAIEISGADMSFVCAERNGKIVVHDFFGANRREFVDKECEPDISVASGVMDRGRELLLPHNSGFLRERPLFFSGEPVKARQFFGFPLVSEEMVLGMIGFVSVSEASLKEGAIALLREISTLFSMYYGALWMRGHLDRVKDLDPVTGCIHFSSFLRIADKAVRKGEPFSLLSVKLTHLDLYNRTMGYEFTDNLLRKVFHVITHCCGRNAFVTREGGGHFYIMLKSNKIIELHNVLKILHYTITKNATEERILDRAGTESGMASFPDDGDNLWDLLKKAGSNRMKRVTKAVTGDG